MTLGRWLTFRGSSYQGQLVGVPVVLESSLQTVGNYVTRSTAANNVHNSKKLFGECRLQRTRTVLNGTGSIHLDTENQSANHEPAWAGAGAHTKQLTGRHRRGSIALRSSDISAQSLPSDKVAGSLCLWRMSTLANESALKSSHLQIISTVGKCRRQSAQHSFRTRVQSAHAVGQYGLPVARRRALTASIPRHHALSEQRLQ